MSASEGNKVLRAAGAMGIGTFMSRILGLVREQVFAVLFGAGNATDAFNIAFRIPNLLRDLFAEGAMSAALVPTFTQVREREGERRAWRLAGLVFRVLLITVTILSLVGIVFAPQLVALYASAFAKVPGKFELTVVMTRVMFPFFPLVALAAAYMAILNACGKFFLPAFSSALFNLTSIVSGVALAFILPYFGVHSIVGMAIGVVLGGSVQAFCQLPALYRAGYRWQSREQSGKLEVFPVWHRDPALRRMMAMMIPGTIGLAATQVNVLVNSILATSQGPGAVSWLNYAFRLMQFPIGVFGVSLAAATLPTVSKYWARSEVNSVQTTISESLRRVFAVNLPASAGLAFLGVPIIRLLFEYGVFTSFDSHATAAALAAYAVGLTAYSAVKVLVPACYAMGNTRVAVASSVFSVVCAIVLNLILIKPFGYTGLALGTSFAALLNSAFLIQAVKAMLRKAGGDFPLGPLLKSFAVHTGIALAMGGVCWVSHLGLNSWVPDIALGHRLIPMMRAIKVMVLVAEGVVVVVLLARAFQVRETLEVVEVFTNKLKKRLSAFRN